MLKFLLMTTFFVSLRVETAVISQKNSGWSYDDPSQWSNDYPDCGGEHQSPININSSTVVRVDFPQFTFLNYDKVFPETVTNNGHTMMLKLQYNTAGDTMPYVIGGGLEERFNFYQLHFHWGGDISRGSEHRIDNQKFPGELHMVHWNQKYGTYNLATKHPDGLLVLGILIELEKRDNIALRHIEHFEQILHPKVKATSVLSLPLPLEDLLPDNLENIFRYNGSLTTPGCNEAVIWNIYETPIALSEGQLDRFRALFDGQDRPLEDNDRPIQQLNDRIVYYRSQPIIKPRTNTLNVF